MTWSQTFDTYIAKLGLSSAEVAKQLKCSGSMVSYWRRGTTPRAKRLRQIKAWSKGVVVPPSSPRDAAKAA